ncbi:GTP-binding protein SAR1A-like [Camellia sinensis]|uniref:GTP-binding protein SAR1A-like n=1 Tax=Camellia sinensis TaxID=4442 RepID=UPI00103557A7|nr:GTP-binding protein SAR1A-like [Camellia sinensis]
MENAEIQSIKQILGLQRGKQYDSVKTLRYGHLMIMTDQVDSIVYLVDAYDKERFAEAKKELDALLSDDSLANVPFLILGNKIDIPYAASEDESRYYLGLTGVTIGKGNVDLADSNVCRIEVFMCSIARKMGYGDGFKWLSQYIK